MGPKKQYFWPRINMLKGNKIDEFHRWKSVCRNNVSAKKWSPKLIFLIQKLTLKVWFWHFLRTIIHWCFSFYFEYVDFWPKILLFRTHHWRNSITELTLVCTYWSDYNVTGPNLFPAFKATMTHEHVRSFHWYSRLSA